MIDKLSPENHIRSVVKDANHFLVSIKTALKYFVKCDAQGGTVTSVGPKEECTSPAWSGGVETHATDKDPTIPDKNGARIKKDEL